jgi:hypothetical protein
MTENDLTNPRRKATIRISINYCSVPGKCEPAFVGLADLQNPPHKWHGFRIFAHNPEVSGSLAWWPVQANPLPATIFQAPFLGRFWFKHALIPWLISCEERMMQDFYNSLPVIDQEYHFGESTTIYQFR